MCSLGLVNYAVGTIAIHCCFLQVMPCGKMSFLIAKSVEMISKFFPACCFDKNLYDKDGWLIFHFKCRSQIYRFLIIVPRERRH